jgi:hypothetical protein
MAYYTIFLAVQIENVLSVKLKIYIKDLEYKLL